VSIEVFERQKRIAAYSTAAIRTFLFEALIMITVVTFGKDATSIRRHEKRAGDFTGHRI
jgi:hypothetical protein